MFTIKSCFTVTEPPVCDLARLVGLLPDVKRCGEILCSTRTRAQAHTQRERERETFVSLHCIHISGFFLSAHPDKGPLQTRSSQGCHLLANMLSVIFCALGSPSKAGPHGSPAHANRTNPSRTCLSVSLSPSFSCLLNPPLLLPLFLFLSASSCLVSSLSHLFLSLSTCFPSSVCVSLFLRPRTQRQGRVSAKCSRAVVNLCVFPCMVVDSPLLADPEMAGSCR